MPHSFKASDNSLLALSPLDGRYASKIQGLTEYFSEFALIKYRVKIEIEYLIAFFEIGPEKNKIDKSAKEGLRELVNNFSLADAQSIKEIEKEINHDVKAVEYFIKKEMKELGLGHLKEWVHFGLTSQDINNTAYPMMTRDALKNSIIPAIETMVNSLDHISKDWINIIMLARTHGQAASPTSLGKELMVFSERIRQQLTELKAFKISGKFGGATGNFNAHKVAFPKMDWPSFANNFLQDYLGIQRQALTTQIENYDHLASLFDQLKRINTILLDLCRDIWHYISINYLNQKSKKNEVGSSAMPHKVNPIDFENAEGNLGVANALFSHLSAKLPISRLQRDLTDSTVLRNTGIPFGHSLVSYQSISKGIQKISPNQEVINLDLENNWMVVSEGIQSVLRREGFKNPYEELKSLTRGHQQIGKKEIHHFIDGLNISESLKSELKEITPQNYYGILPSV